MQIRALNLIGQLFNTTYFLLDETVGLMLMI